MSIGATALILFNRIAATIDITLVTRAFYSDQRANAMWLAPFELSLAYSPTDFGIPTSATLRLGHVCRKHTISRWFPVGRTYRLYAIAHSFFANRPSSDDGWAANVTLCPYNEAEQCHVRRNGWRRSSQWLDHFPCPVMFDVLPITNI